MQWLEFHNRVAILVISPRTFREEPRVGRLMEAMTSDRTVIEKETILREFILSCRPDLQGCLLHTFGYDPAAPRCEVFVEHCSFEPVAALDEPPRIPLIPKGALCSG